VYYNEIVLPVAGVPAHTAPQPSTTPAGRPPSPELASGAAADITRIAEGLQPPAQPSGQEPEIPRGTGPLPTLAELQAAELRKLNALRMGLPFIPLVPGHGMEAPPEAPGSPAPPVPPPVPELAPAGAELTTPEAQAGPSGKGKKRGRGSLSTPEAMASPDSKGKGVLTRSQRAKQAAQEKKEKEAAEAARKVAAGIAAAEGKTIEEVLKELEQVSALERQTINPDIEQESEEEDLFSLAHKKARK
jgi:hypothetical protein